MPSSFGHFAVAYMIHRFNKTLSLPALIVGSIISDIDILLYYLTKESFAIGRDLLHSIVGVGTLGVLISVLLTMFLYPKIVSTFFRIDKKEIEQECKFSKIVVLSSFLGGLSHVLVDSLCHNYNPLFYPFTRESIDVLLFTNDWRLSYAIVEVLIFTMLLIMLAAEIKKGTKGFWKRILVGHR